MIFFYPFFGIKSSAELLPSEKASETANALFCLDISKQVLTGEITPAEGAALITQRRASQASAVLDAVGDVASGTWSSSRDFVNAIVNTIKNAVTGGSVNANPDYFHPVSRSEDSILFSDGSKLEWYWDEKEVITYQNGNDPYDNHRGNMRFVFTAADGTVYNRASSVINYRTGVGGSNPHPFTSSFDFDKLSMKLESNSSSTTVNLNTLPFNKNADTVDPGDPDFDANDLSYDDLLKLLDELMDDVTQNNLDLSTVEGLLRALLNDLEHQRTDEALDDILAAILSLAQDMEHDNSALLDALNKLLDKLGNSSASGEAADLSEIVELLKKMKIDLDYLCGVETADLLLDESGKIIKSFSAKEQKIIKELAELLTSLTAAMGYSAASALIGKLQSMLFTKLPPSDLAITFMGRSYVLLDIDLIKDHSYSIQIVKDLSSFLLLFSFVLALRRKLVKEV